MQAICVLNDDSGASKGMVTMTQLNPSGVEFVVKIWHIPPGKHGFHVHRSGNISQGSHSLCDHFNPNGGSHGGLNEPRAHSGDLGNLVVDENGECSVSFVARFVSLLPNSPHSIIGRSLVVHSQEDDLGRGSFPDSTTTGHSGGRLLYGIIGIDEGCENQQVSHDDGCSVM
jgi:superoxide dismutase, Cu-Zn family